MSKKTSKKRREQIFQKEIDTLARDENILRMKKYVQHGSISTYDHCLDVARLSCRIGEMLPVQVNDRELIRGALLHDYFLYDWHHYDKPWHGLTHPEEAKKNAIRDYNITPLEQNIIESHMWPLTPLALPRSKEAVVVNIADKICSVRETLFRR